MIAADARTGGVHPKSEVPGCAVAAPREVIIDWAAQI
jgi:hypothetical protein